MATVMLRRQLWRFLDWSKLAMMPLGPLLEAAPPEEAWSLNESTPACGAIPLDDQRWVASFNQLALV
jgi:hypothetical protein